MANRHVERAQNAVTRDEKGGQNAYLAQVAKDVSWTVILVTHLFVEATSMTAMNGSKLASVASKSR